MKNSTELKKLTLSLLATSIKKNLFTGNHSYGNLLSFIMQCRVVIKNAADKDSQQSDENIHDTGFEDNFDIDLYHSSQNQNKTNENEGTDEELIMKGVYKLIKNEVRSNRLPLEITFDRPPIIELTQQDSMNLKFHQLLEDSNVTRSATENIVNFLNKEVYNRNIYRKFLYLHKSYCNAVYLNFD